VLVLFLIGRGDNGSEETETNSSYPCTTLFIAKILAYKCEKEAL
jgi:hypothetical protein